MAELDFKIRKGLNIALPGAPVQAIEPGPELSRLAVLGADYPGIRTRLHVSEGERVRIGQVLFTDRRRRAIQVTSPACGTIYRIVMGNRRHPYSIEITSEGGEAIPFPVPTATRAAGIRHDELEALLLASGLWTTIRTRPFGAIPTPGTRPAGLFVTAIDTHPLAPSPAAVIAERECEFTCGLAALTGLTEGPLYLCQGPGAALPRPEHVRISVARFDGPHPAGLPGTHIHLLMPVSVQRTVWHIGYQDVIAVGGLLMTGTLPVERIVALGGPIMARPRLVRARLGAALVELLDRELLEGADREPRACHIISGSVLAGRAATVAEAYLGQRHLQVCAIPKSGGSDWIPARPVRRRAFVAVPAFERVLPMHIPPAPLLRALLIEDDDAALALGALELGEEDLALLSFICPARHDYGALLRAMLSRFQDGR